MNERAYRAAEQRLWQSIAVDPVERWIHLERNDVDVRIQELGGGPPVLFIHGANTSGASWATLAAKLDGFRCLILDRPGTGLSQPIRRPIDRVSLPEIADTLVGDILDALELPTAHIVATSLGGYVALRGAAASPERIDRMVQFSWPVGAPIPHLPWTLRAMSIPGLSRLAASMPANEQSVRMLFRRMGHGPKLKDGRITQEDLDCYVAMLRDTDTMRNEIAPARALISPIRGLAALDLTDEMLSKVTCPTLFIWGGQDVFGGPDVARELVARIPNAELDVMPDAGHSPWLDDLDRCAKAVTDFLLRNASMAQRDDRLA
ncbi:MAG TPA: alpha/beta hydrolase [Candidatus Limnocylindrales bacterium]|nr:alpha/beta hydrolase [Candidatus Limnocylindrales bacterium]